MYRSSNLTLVWVLEPTLGQYNYEVLKRTVLIQHQQINLGIEQT